MAKILLDYVFPISVIEPTPAASTGYLKQAVVIAKPKAGQEANIGNVYECTLMSEVLARTDNTEAQQLFNAGMSRVFILLASDLNVATAMLAVHGEVWTALISSDFTDADVAPSTATLVKAQLTFNAKQAGDAGNDITIAFIAGGVAGSEVVTVVGKAISVSMATGVSTATQLKTALDANPDAFALINTVIAGGGGATTQPAFAVSNLVGGDGLDVGSFDGVVGFSSDDAVVCQSFGSADNRVGFFRLDANGAKNMFFAFGKLLSNQANWTNQQYISMPYNDGVATLGTANSLFDDKISFVMNDTEFGNRLGLFVAGGKAIIAPYIKKNLRIDLQSRSLTWLASNQPQYTLTEAALLESRLQEDIMEQRYIQTKWIREGKVTIKLLQDNFVASGFIDISEPTALWRIYGEMSSTL